ncbi:MULTISPECIES: VOC family protein [Acidobacterium]|uniref:Glyoxalase family protein n=1 Tax=Acidobacterium capsulatum (strain ATCC 51196 / DSM 11244 / BCRC 80197 / JCM 7670 / NBRC 15755 / NCIMB 13165 / 161) TaxID=240015 RepID=C1F1I6_ACIC5|nr:MULTISPECIES: VOC family protein [Acidobacterium]ACO31737.1 glyoxalase family protein [Acidobacterium capsulatum ATCC 51196]HCT61392.1 glyoxalase/bleomycin resistance/dioxygenase family protein [Acidobacterium sp.]
MLSSSRLTAFLTVPDAALARNFYRDTLGLTLTHEDRFALAFDANGTPLRVAIFPDFKPQPFTVLGWQVPDAVVMSRQMQSAGIAFERFDGLAQDEHGLWNAPGGSRVGWFRDPFGNLLSIHDAAAAMAI